jgi:hypothetical protein
VLPLLTLQVRDREFLLNTDLRYRNSMAAYIRRMLGYNPFMPKNEAAPLIEKAQAVLKHVMDFGDVVPGCELECKAAWNLHQTMDYNPLRNADAVKRRETAIVAYYPDLPGQELVESVPGLGELAYALFIGTVGDVSRFASVSAFWKYCGLAVDENGRRIPRKAKRCAAYRMMTPVMKRANVYRDFYLLEKDRITGKRENGDYGEDAIISPHKRAERHATKEMLKDIWLAWAEKPARTRAQVLGKFGDYEAKLTRIKDDLARAKAEKKQREED